MLALAVIGGGLYGGYRWTQTQYYVGTNGEHVALYRGISQDLAWVSLSKVEKDHPEIELKYLPPYQQKQVEATIAEGGLTDAQKKIDELAVAGLRVQEGRRAPRGRRRPPRSNREDRRRAEAGGSHAEPRTPPSRPRQHRAPRAPPTPSRPATATPTPGPSLSEEEQKVVSRCGKQ